MPPAQREHQLLGQVVLDRPHLLQAPTGGRPRAGPPASAAAGSGRHTGASTCGRLSAGIAPPNDVWAIDTEADVSAPRFSRSDRNCRLSRWPAPRWAISQVKLPRPSWPAGSIGTAGGDEQGKRSRFEPVHFLGDEGQAAGELVGVDFLSHRGSLEMEGDSECTQVSLLGHFLLATTPRTQPQTPCRRPWSAENRAARRGGRPRCCRPRLPDRRGRCPPA